MQSSKIDRIKYLVEQLNAASESYYAKDREIMSNYEYDKLYDELVELEKETGVTLANSPTVNVGYEAVDELPKERHESPMLSLGKTKSREELREWLQGNPAILSWKLDGLTIVLTYREGKLAKAVTRGNGEIGEVITNNARTFKNLPLNISYTGELILRGEAVITYSDFEKINGEIADAEAKYKNPSSVFIQKRQSGIWLCNDRYHGNGYHVGDDAFHLCRTGGTIRTDSARTQAFQYDCRRFGICAE